MLVHRSSGDRVRRRSGVWNRRYCLQGRGLLVILVILVIFFVVIICMSY